MAGTESPLNQDQVFSCVLMPCAVNARDTDSEKGALEQQPEAHSSHHAEVSTPHAQHRGKSEAKEASAWRQVAVLLFCWGIFVMFTLLLSRYTPLQPRVLERLCGAGCRLSRRWGPVHSSGQLISSPAYDLCHSCFSSVIQRQDNVLAEDGAVQIVH